MTQHKEKWCLCIHCHLSAETSRHHLHLARTSQRSKITRIVPSRHSSVGTDVMWRKTHNRHVADRIKQPIPAIVYHNSNVAEGHYGKDLIILNTQLACKYRLDHMEQRLFSGDNGLALCYVELMCRHVNTKVIHVNSTKLAGSELGVSGVT